MYNLDVAPNASVVFKLNTSSLVVELHVMMHCSLLSFTTNAMSTSCTSNMPRNQASQTFIYLYRPPWTSSDKDTVLFKDSSVLWNLALHVLLCQLWQLDLCLFLGVPDLGLLFPLLFQSGCDSLVLPANLMGQTSKEGKLGKASSHKGQEKLLMKKHYKSNY